MSKNRNTISKKFILDYVIETYGSFRHNIDNFIKAIRKTSKYYSLNKKDLFYYIIERRNTITGATSYGFDTDYGREIRNTFEHYYYYYN